MRLGCSRIAWKTSSSRKIRTFSKGAGHRHHGQLRAHRVEKVRNWLARHPRYRAHFTPTGGSWLNLVERLFAEVTERCVRRWTYGLPPILGFLVCGYIWLSLSLPAKAAGALWLTVGICYGAWQGNLKRPVAISVS